MQLRHFSFCGPNAVQLQKPFYAHLQKDYQKLIGAPYAGEKVVKDGHLFACGYCPICARIHATVRRVEYSESSDPHICNAKCMSAVGPACECSCGGLNHGGRGYNPNQSGLFEESE